MTSAAAQQSAWPLGAPPAGPAQRADDGQAVARAAAADPEAFESLVRRHGLYVYNLALHTLGDVREAEDAAQEAFVRAWRAIGGFRSEAGVRTWLYRITVNVCFDRLPRLRHDLAGLDVDSESSVAALTDEGDGLDEAVGRAQLAAAVRSAVAELPTSYRLLLTLRHFDDLSYDEIAHVTGMPIGTVKTGIHRARGQLRVRLANVAAG